MSEEELAHLTGRKQQKSQREALDVMGIYWKVNAAGKLLVGRKHVEKVFGGHGREARHQVKPNFDALTGQIIDPRAFLGLRYPEADLLPSNPAIGASSMLSALPLEEAREVQIQRGPNIAQLPEIEPLLDRLKIATLLTMGDNISTDTINPAGAEAMPFRSNVQAISQLCFRDLDKDYPKRGAASRETGGHALVAGHNYGQGSSREHAVLAPQYLGLRLVLAKSFARIHYQNLINAGILALVFQNPQDHDRLEPDDVLEVVDVHGQVEASNEVIVRILARITSCRLCIACPSASAAFFMQRGLINWLRQKSTA